MEQIEQLKMDNKDLKKALDKMNGKYSKATQELTAAKLEVEHLVRVRNMLEKEKISRSQKMRTDTKISMLIGIVVGMLIMWGVGYVQ
nr:MAG TPA: G-rich domain on putative tyrosine kinase [Caudoviricetes sp.]